MWALFIEGNLLFGSRKVIHNVVANADIIRAIDYEAMQYSYGRGAAFHAMLMGVLAVRDYIPSLPDTFPDMQTLLRLFVNCEPQKLALHCYNGQRASVLMQGIEGVENSTPEMVYRLDQAIKQGELLDYQQGIDRLALVEYQADLPGIILFLLEQRLVHNDALTGYLRRGSSLQRTEEMHKRVVCARPVCRTWAQDAQTHPAEVQ